jgi:hypothetical protein
MRLDIKIMHKGDNIIFTFFRLSVGLFSYINERSPEDGKSGSPEEKPNSHMEVCKGIKEGVLFLFTTIC